jgi:ribosomal-protein-serine acetyltransferase
MKIERENEVPADEHDPFGEPVYSRDGRVHVRRYRPEDIDDAYALVDKDRPRFSRAGLWAGRKYTSKKLMHIDYVESPDPDRTYLGIWNAEETYVGHLELYVYHKEPVEGSFTYYIGKEFEGNGFMTSAVETVTQVGFTQMGLKKVRGLVFNHNVRSASVFSRLGFSPVPIGSSATRFIRGNPHV